MDTCPECGSDDVYVDESDDMDFCVCGDCGYEWEEQDD